MNILGIGTTELLIILVLMLMVAGPKRMIQWAYVVGVYAGKLRKMWQEASGVIKQELENSGLEPEMIDTLEQMANPRSRNAAFSSQLDRLTNEFKAPVEDSLKPAQAALDEARITPLAPKAAQSAAANGGAAESDSTTESITDSPGRYDAWTRN